ncbi:unnamed protein product [Anisakis simplex]|uniref:Coiled-coil domain-containing protein 6 n=1 Tax=Anisakis simplex TaxID=6269 RepID=A0A0M3K1Q6_ANISI|nr:unnamed protein product [Anisakis simplex]
MSGGISPGPGGMDSSTVAGSGSDTRSATTASAPSSSSSPSQSATAATTTQGGASIHHIRNNSLSDDSQRIKHTRRPRASTEELPTAEHQHPNHQHRLSNSHITSFLLINSAQTSPQMMSETMSDVISDAKLISLNEGQVARTSVHYDQLLNKAMALLKEKSEREDEILSLRSRIESLQELNRTIREKSVRLHAKAEQEEEFISNMLLKRIQKLKNDKEAIALKYEQEEEFLTNDLTRKLSQLQNERDELAGRAKAEQSSVVDTLLVKIRKLEAEINANHVALEQLRREKVDLENALEHEQEQLFNTLGKRMDQLEAEKRRMQARLDQASVSEDQSPASSNHELFGGFVHEELNSAEPRRSTPSRAEVEARKLREECSGVARIARAVSGDARERETRAVVSGNGHFKVFGCVSVSGWICFGTFSLWGHFGRTRARTFAYNDTKHIRSQTMSAVGVASVVIRERARVRPHPPMGRSIFRAFLSEENAREALEDKRIDELLSNMSAPKSSTPTPGIGVGANSPTGTRLANVQRISTIEPTVPVDGSSNVWHDERPLSARSESQGERMEEGSEAADTDGDAQMEANCYFYPNITGFCASEPTKLINIASFGSSTLYGSSISGTSNEDSNESSESVATSSACGGVGGVASGPGQQPSGVAPGSGAQFARPALPANRSPVNGWIVVLELYGDWDAYEEDLERTEDLDMDGLRAIRWTEPAGCEV